MYTRYYITIHEEKSLIIIYLHQCWKRTEVVRSLGQLTDQKTYIQRRTFLYIIPWNRLKCMWIVYFGLQGEFPEGISTREITKALRICKRHENNPGVKLPNGKKIFRDGQVRLRS